MSLPTKTGYFLLKVLTWFVQIFPLRFHYVVSDILSLVVMHVVRYRRSVIVTNLRNSFPGKPDAWILRTTRKFYAHFCDSVVETFYFDRITEKEIKKRLTILNEELVENYLDEGRHVILALGHYNNWEWNCSFPLHTRHNHSGYVVYKKLTNKSFDEFYYNLRARFGIRPLERADTYRHLVGEYQAGRPTATAFLMDQTPRKSEIQYWTTFLNQDTPVLTGTEKVARKLDAVVLFCHIRKMKRGYNRLEFKVITEHARNTDQFEITEKATRMIEEVIHEQPELWLWSHKRWKHKREDHAENVVSVIPDIQS